MAGEFRTCPTTGLKVHLPAETLIKVNAVTAIVFLLIGGILALLLLLTRWQAVHLLNPDFFYRFLTLHGIAMLIAWIVYFEVALLYFTSAVLLNSRLAAPWAAWLAYGLMTVGGLITVVAVLAGGSDVMFTSYVPLKASPFYYLGIILFAVGAIIACIIFFATLVVAKHEKTYEGSVPLVTFGAAMAAIIAIGTLAHGAIAFIPTMLWAAGAIPMMDPETYRLLFWGFGHSSQQINVCAMIACWYTLATLTVGAQPLSEKFSRFAFVFYALFINIASEHHLLWDPGISSAHKMFNTSYFLHLAVLASMMHAFSVPACIEVAQRKKGYTKGLFEWLKKGPWGDPAFASLVFSVAGFGFLGGITGVMYGTEQLNILGHNSLRVPGHFHATVVVGTSMAFMGITYYVLPLVFQRQVMFPTVAKLQPYFFGIGMWTVSIAMMFVGSFGVPRRHWDITLADAPFQYSFGPTVDLGMAIVAVGGILAVIGGAMFCVIAVATVLAGKKVNQ